MRSRVAAVGVGFLSNSSSRVTSWSWVARWRLWFFCCWVRVLLRDGRRELLRCCWAVVVVVEEVGDGVEAGLELAVAGVMVTGVDAMADRLFERTRRKDEGRKRREGEPVDRGERWDGMRWDWIGSSSRSDSMHQARGKERNPHRQKGMNPQREGRTRRPAVWAERR